MWSLRYSCPATGCWPHLFLIPYPDVPGGDPHDGLRRLSRSVEYNARGLKNRVTRIERAEYESRPHDGLEEALTAATPGPVRIDANDQGFLRAMGHAAYLRARVT